MNLYHISQTEVDDYDTYDSAVVAAEDEQAAMSTHPSSPATWGISYGVWCQTPEAVTARLIGVAVLGTPPGVICASFNAG